MSPRVSVIIPVYNVEKYIHRCVDSVLKQTLTDIEIILVDDGSPDGSPAICDKYAVQDSRVHVIHKENGGLASARNAGIRLAVGEYIFFVDSDDWIDAETLEELVAIADAKDVDFVRYRPMYAGWPDHKDGELCDFGTESMLNEGVYNKDTIRKVIYPHLITTKQLTLGPIVAAWRSLYRRAFLEDNRLLFDDLVRYSEDSVFSARVICATNSFYYLDGAKYYHYFYNKDSITKSFKSDRWDSSKELIRCFERDFSEYPDYDFSEQLIRQKMFCVLNTINQRYAIRGLIERVEYCKMICYDPITVRAFRHTSLADVPFKLRIVLWLIRFKRYRTLARI